MSRPLHAFCVMLASDSGFTMPEYAMPRGHASDFTLRPFRFFRILSPLSQFEAFTGLTTIFLSLKTGVRAPYSVRSLCSR
eukprot:2671573-Rhodomonas_salina.1